MGEPLSKQVQHLTEKGFTEKQAVALVHYCQDFMDESHATKKDIVLVQKDIEQLRSEVKRDIEQIRKDITILKKDLVIYMGSIMTGGIVVLGVLIKILNL